MKWLAWLFGGGGPNARGVYGAGPAHPIHWFGRGGAETLCGVSGRWATESGRVTCETCLRILAESALLVPEPVEPEPEIPSEIPNPLKVAGTSRQQAALREIEEYPESTDRRGRSRFRATVRREPGNPHDPNAFVVIVNGEKIGYVPRDVAAALVAVRAHPDEVTCNGYVVGGDGRTLGARLWLADEL